ncbi:chalcone synthase-like [Durio zibethinus]|uniref:Chalcone synthase-like n=1 Tax=Durio zibethinus TaxID=66656 RepID=A0A6P6APB7_DURZI|nr:chalcone synthase-like [Durio zibethinus]
MSSLENFGRRTSAQGLETILSIGKANPANYISQADFSDYYFRITKSEHIVQLKKKFKRTCEKSMIRKRHFVLTEEIIYQNPNITTYIGKSLDIRQQIIVPEVPKLAPEAASKATITHLMFSAISGVDMPGADYHLTKLLGLPSSIKRVMMYFQGCYASGTILRMAKDFAENNAGARVLVGSSDISFGTFRAPNEHDTPSLIGNAIMGDGAVAMIIGADPDLLKERPLFQIISATENIVPDSHGAIEGHLREAGLSIHLSKDVPKLIANNIESCLAQALNLMSFEDWNRLFWIVHPGNAILDQIELILRLKKEKLLATQHVLSEFGNMFSGTVFFILDKMRRKSLEVGKATTGEGQEWGVLCGLGAGITVDIVVLRSFPTNTFH